MGIESDRCSGEERVGAAEECKALLFECFRRVSHITGKIRHSLFEIRSNLGNFRTAGVECSRFMANSGNVPIAPLKINPLLSAVQTLEITLASIEGTIRSEYMTLTLSGFSVSLIDRLDSINEELKDQEDSQSFMRPFDASFEENRESREQVPTSVEALEALYASARDDIQTILLDIRRFSNAVARMRQQLELQAQVDRRLLESALESSPHLLPHESGHLEDQIGTIHGLANGYFAVVDIPIEHLSAYYRELQGVLDTHLAPIIQALKRRSN